MQEKDAIDIINQLKTFMTHTNEMLEKLIIRVGNLEVDVNNLRKKIKDNDNGKLIISR